MSKKTTPETHPNYRPPVDAPPLELGAPTPSRDGGPLPSCEPCRFVVSGLLAPSECSALISAAERAGPAGVGWEYDPSYRDCSRVVLRSRTLADAVHARLLPLLSAAECESVRPFGFDGGGDWRPLKANEVVRVSRYDAGGRFERHKDGAFVENDDVRSVYTVLAYLNEPPAFGGGATRVFLPPSSHGGGDAGIAVIPRTGAALVMTHDTEHAGEVVTSGHKYVARFDLMFRRLGGSMTEAELARLPDRALAEKLYHSSIVKQRDGDPRGSTEDYVRALNLQARLPSSGDHHGPSSGGIGRADSPSDALDEDVLVRVLRFLEPADVASASGTSRRWRLSCASGLLWRELFVLRWPTLSRGESTVLGREGAPGDGRRIPPAVYEDPESAEGRRRRLHTVFVAVLPGKSGPGGIPFRPVGEERLRKELYGNKVPGGYMYSSLRMSNLGQVARHDSRIGWKRFHASVHSGAIHFTEFSELAEREAVSQCGWYGRLWKDSYDASRDKEMNVPSPISIEHDTDLSFSFGPDSGKHSRGFVDSCVVELPGDEYLAICKNDPRINNPEREPWFSPTFAGILEDIARVVVGRQTEAALGYGDVVVKCDAKTKQWRAAYARRHVAEKFFDVVTIDIGQRRTKFTANNVTVEDALDDGFSWNEVRHLVMHRFFVMAMDKYGRDMGVNEDWGSDAREYTSNIASSGHATSLVSMAMKDPEMLQEIPRTLSEASHGCGSIASLISRSMGHLWSAGHGLQNHHVGDRCIEIGGATAPFNADGDPDGNAMAIIYAHVVERTFVRRARRRNNFIRTTCAEHPVNIVEPALGFTEEVRIQLARKLASFQVPFVGFVNGATAALMCGEQPRRDGIVIMLGGVNSAVVPVVDGVADTLRGIPLTCCADEKAADYPNAIAEEAGTAVRQLLASTGGGATADRLVPVLVTGGRASNAAVAAIRSSTHKAHFYTASGEGERHLDACRGAHILANLSDGRKHFRTVLHTMWSLDSSGMHHSEN